MATIPIPTDPTEALELAQELLAEHGHITTLSEPGVGLVYSVPDDAEDEPPTAPQGDSAHTGSDEPDSASETAKEPTPEPESEPVKPEPKKAPAKKPAAAGAAATD